MDRTYRNQVELLLAILPEVAKETCFALHGGTAINLFVRDMPRLSVDVDLTYIPLEDRNTSLQRIAEALERIKKGIETILPDIRVQHQTGIGKLLISKPNAIVKVEVSQVGRGVISPPIKMELCAKAQAAFDAFTVNQMVSLGQLFGGKICAALDRQHPRDLFDVKFLLEKEGFSHEVKTGFLYCLICSDRPMNEVLKPNYQDQRAALASQFSGMTELSFSYEEYEFVRKELVKTIYEGLTIADRRFLLSVKRLLPDWSYYDFERFPAVQWKLHNLQRLKEQNPKKHNELYAALERQLDRTTD